MKKAFSLLLSLGVVLCAVGCDEEKTEAPEAAAAPAATAPPEKTAEEKAAGEKLAADQAKRAEEEAKAQAELAKNPITECCRALGKNAFTMRSPEYMAASKVCGDALQAEKKLDTVLDDIKKQLKDKALPDECVAK